jgi:uncharacterized glyoxalase superfamily protein PhnB
MASVKPIPDGREGTIPHLVVQGGAKAIEFYKKAFGAEERMRAPTPDGRILHAELRIGGSVFYLCDEFPEMRGNSRIRSPGALGATPVTIHRYVTDADAVIRRAVEAGATVLMPAADTFWGDRYGMVADPFGHCWSFATHKRDVTPEEMERAQKAFSAQAARSDGHASPAPTHRA